MVSFSAKGRASLTDEFFPVRLGAAVYEEEAILDLKVEVESARCFAVGNLRQVCLSLRYPLRNATLEAIRARDYIGEIS